MTRKTKFATINEKLTGLYLHLLVFFAVNFGLFLLNVLVFPFTIWFYFPLLMWGVAVAIHGFAVFVRHEDVWNEKSVLEVVRKGLL